MTPVVLLPWQQLCFWFCFKLRLKFPDLRTIYSPTNGETKDDMRTTCVPLANGDICFFTETGAKSIAMTITQQVSLCFFFVMYFSGASLKNTALTNISGDILDSVLYCSSVTIYYVITFLICIIQKQEYLGNKKRYSKKNNAILLYFEKPIK